MNDDELERYARHIMLKELGGAGQRALCAAHVALVGLGGLGGPAAMALAAAGAGRLTLIDDDRVSLSNLQRQTLFASADVSALKVEAGAARLHALNPHVEIVPAPERLTAANAAALLGGADLIVDGTDNFAARFAVNDASLALGLPLVWGAAEGWSGQWSVCDPRTPASPCYRCLVPEPPPGAEGCEGVGVAGPLTQLVGSAMALEAIKIAAGAGTPAVGLLTLYDGLAARLRTVRLTKDPACPACSR